MAVIDTFADLTRRLPREVGTRQDLENLLALTDAVLHGLHDTGVYDVYNAVQELQEALHRRKEAWDRRIAQQDRMGLRVTTQAVLEDCPNLLICPACGTPTGEVESPVSFRCVQCQATWGWPCG